MRVRFIANLLIWSAVATFAQATAPSPSFEVASIRPTDPSARAAMRFSGGPGTSSPGQLTVTNYPLEPIIRKAYNLNHQWEFMIPASARIDRYDIAAKVPAGATKEQFLLMLQNLLVERFGLVAHKEAREMPIYELVVTKGGPRIAAAEVAPAGAQTGQSSGAPLSMSALPKDRDGWPILPPDAIGRFQTDRPPDTRQMYRGQPISQLVDYLELLCERPVMDKTGLTKIYSFDLTFPRPTAPAAPPSLPDAAGKGATTTPAMLQEETAPGVLAAMERQLGLKVVSSKGPVEVLVVDHINKTPTEN